MVSPSAQPRDLIQRKLLAEARVEAGSSNMRVGKSTTQMMEEMIISSKESKENEQVKLVRRSSKVIAPGVGSRKVVTEKLIMGVRKEDVEVVSEPTISE